MTNEDIEREVLKIIVPVAAPLTTSEGLVTMGTTALKELVEQCARAIVLEALEEAETTVLNYDVHMAEEMRSRTDVARTYSEQAASRVRALKSQLVQEPVASS